MGRVRRYPGILLFIVLAAACAVAQINCPPLDSQILKRQVRYCVQLPANYADARDASGKPARYPVLYFLHGLGDNEQTLFKTGGWTLIEDLRERKKIGNFLIVAPEGRNSFYINSADGKDRYSDFFLQEFVPFIEKKYRVKPGRSGRAIGGISMGGFGALRMAFANPQLFSSVSAQAPALILESPKNINAAARSGSPVIRALTGVFGNPINVAHWDANNPFLLANKN